VIFPSTWSRHHREIRNNEVLIVRGKVDKDKAEPKVLVEAVEVVQLSHQPNALQAEEEGIEEFFESELTDEFLDGNNEPLDDIFPYEQSSAGLILEADTMDRGRRNQSKVSKSTLRSQGDENISDRSGDYALERMDNLHNGTLEPTERELFEHTPTIPEKEAKGVKTVLIRLSSTGDKERDQRRLSQIFAVLTSLPGNDHFAFICQENSSTYRLDFPNYRTSISDALIRELKGMAGEANISVE